MQNFRQNSRGALSRSAVPSARGAWRVLDRAGPTPSLLRLVESLYVIADSRAESPRRPSEHEHDMQPSVSRGAWSPTAPRQRTPRTRFKGEATVCQYIPCWRRALWSQSEPPALSISGSACSLFGFKNPRRQPDSAVLGRAAVIWGPGTVSTVSLLATLLSAPPAAESRCSGTALYMQGVARPVTQSGSRRVPFFQCSRGGTRSGVCASAWAACSANLTPRRTTRSCHVRRRT